MSRIIGFRRRRARIPAFEEALVALQDELQLTQAFVSLMLRDGDVRVAAAVIDEQRSRLSRAEGSMTRAFRPRSRRSQVAAGGLAAVLALGSMSIAALSSRDRAEAPSAPEVIQQAGQKLQRAAVASSDVQAEAMVADAFDDLSAIEDQVSRDPSMVGTLLGGRLGDLLRARPAVAAEVRRQIDLLRKKGVRITVTLPTTEPSAAPSPVASPEAPEPDDGSSTDAPAPPAPPGG